MLHVCRDFITLGNTNIPQACVYFHAIFLRTVMNFTVVGNTGFNLDGGTFTLGSGGNGTISAASGFTNRFTPDGGYVVSSNDINRILVIKSNLNPMLTSGLWRVTGVDTVSNQLILGLRGEPPVAETGLTWRLHPAETSFTFNQGTNGNTNQYRGRTSASNTARIILQAPHATGWQVRLTYESTTDVSTPLPRSTIAPGMVGDTLGDFPVGGNHLHPMLFFNTSVQNNPYVGYTAGWTLDVTAMLRFYIWGEDSTGTVVGCTRQVDSSNTNSMVAYGFPEDEEYPTDAVTVRRLFVYGQNSNGLNSNILNFQSGPRQSIGNCMTAFGYSGQPIAGGTSVYCYLTGQQFDTDGPRYNGNGSDDPFLAVTQLLTVDLIAGTWDYMDFNGQAQSLFLEPRRLGRFPIARMGRSNYGSWTTSTDGPRQWLHTLNGVYLPWSGAILP